MCSCFNIRHMCFNSHFQWSVCHILKKNRHLGLLHGVFCLSGEYPFQFSVLNFKISLMVLLMSQMSVFWFFQCYH